MHDTERKKRDIQAMETLLTVAREAAARGEIPIAASLVLNDELIASAANCRESRQDPTGHAEILCLRKAAELLKTRFFPEATLYVTIEHCLMCLGAIVQARVGRVVYGASEPKFGAMHLFEMDQLPVNHHPEIIGGICADEAAMLMREFFQKRRILNRQVGSRALRRQHYEEGFLKIDPREDDGFVTRNGH